MEIYYYGAADAYLTVSLFRQKLGTGYLSQLQDSLVDFTPSGSTSSMIESTDSTAIQYAKVLRDYRYFLYTEIMNTSGFYGAKIFYRK